MLTFQEQTLVHDLSRLPPSARVAFAAACAQRLANVYQTFLGQDDRADKCNDAIEYASAHILTDSDEAITEQLITGVMALIPDQDAPGWTPLTAYAEDALSSLAYCLQCLKTSDPQFAVWAARRVYEALDFFVTTRDHISPDNTADERRILGDSFVQAELARQTRDLSDLNSARVVVTRAARHAATTKPDGAGHRCNLIQWQPGAKRTSTSSMERLETLAPELARRLKRASPTRQRAVAIVAAEFALDRTGLRHHLIDE